MATITQNVDTSNFSDTNEMQFKKSPLSDFTLDAYYKGQRIAIINGVSAPLQWTAKNGSNVPLKVIEKLEKIKPLRGVYGNIDGEKVRKIFPEVSRFTIENVEVLMIHIGGYPGKYPPEIKLRQ